MQYELVVPGSIRRMDTKCTCNATIVRDMAITSGSRIEIHIFYGPVMKMEECDIGKGRALKIRVGEVPLTSSDSPGQRRIWPPSQTSDRCAAGDLCLDD